MSNHAEHAAQGRSVAPPARLPAENVESPVLHLSARTGDSQALRDLADTLDYAARVLERLLPAHRTDVRADIALLKMIAGNARGFARTMEEATS